MSGEQEQQRHLTARGTTRERGRNRQGMPVPPATELPRKKEIGGRDGPDPTRYGDWEKAGRCIDF